MHSPHPDDQNHFTEPAEEPSKEMDSHHDPDRGKDRVQWDRAPYDLSS